MIYLASPYAHPNPRVRALRFRDACRAAAELMLAGHLVYSPIVFGHSLIEFGVPSDWEFWSRSDRYHLTHCNEVVVLPLAGWEASVGISWELNLARVLAKPVRFLEPTRTTHG